MNLRERDDIVCIVLRMGELASLHEGQLGHTVANRLVRALELGKEAPSEHEFRAGLGRLVPYVSDWGRYASRLDYENRQYFQGTNGLPSIGQYSLPSPESSKNRNAL